MSNMLDLFLESSPIHLLSELLDLVLRSLGKFLLFRISTVDATTSFCSKCFRSTVIVDNQLAWSADNKLKL